jgi:hypothetical protein
MIKKLCLLLLTVLFLSSANCARGGESTHRSSTGSQSTDVRGYTKKDGTYVAPHARRARGTIAAGARSTHTYSHRSHAIPSEFSGYASAERDSRGKIRRSAAARDAFKRQRPCPSTGKGSGACPGYVIDHVKPLECGGADDPSNMQWQTTRDGKAKDKTERYCR